MANLKKYESTVDSVVRRAILQLRRLEGAEVDLAEWMHIIAVECLGAVVLSWSPGYLKAQSDGGASLHSYLSWRRKSVVGLFPLAVIAGFLWQPFIRIFIDLWGVVNLSPPVVHPRPFFWVRCSSPVPLQARA
jgi:hypothetical protein